MQSSTIAPALLERYASSVVPPGDCSLYSVYFFSVKISQIRVAMLLVKTKQPLYGESASTKRSTTTPGAVLVLFLLSSVLIAGKVSGNTLRQNPTLMANFQRADT